MRRKCLRIAVALLNVEQRVRMICWKSPENAANPSLSLPQMLEPSGSIFGNAAVCILYEKKDMGVLERYSCARVVVVSLAPK
jgi:hypothetical protein